MYKIVSSIGLTEEQWSDGQRYPSTARYSYQVDLNGDVILVNNRPLPGFKVVLEFPDGAEPASIQGIGTNYTLAEIEAILETPEWSGENE